MNQVINTFQSITGQPVDIFTFSDANNALNQALSPRQVSYEAGMNLSQQKQSIQQALQFGVSTGMIDTSSLLAGMMRLNQIQESQQQMTSDLSNFFKGAVQPLAPDHTKHVSSSSSGGGDE
jgi:hypothetical protein